MSLSQRTIQSYRDLDVWNRGIELVVRCYALTRPFPKDERFGLVTQIRRASISVPANMAEGFGREHLSFSRSSLMELETHPLIAYRVTFIDRRTLKQAFNETDPLGRSLSMLIKSLKRHQRK